jgi:hypothetical protein
MLYAKETGARKKWRCRMNRASPVDLRKASKSPTTWRIGIRFVPIPVATEEEFQTLAADLSRRRADGGRSREE